MELLRQHTDEQHPLTTNQICAAMTEMGIPCDRRIVTQDVAVLNEMGYEILSDMVGHEKVYFVEDRSFSLPEMLCSASIMHSSLPPLSKTGRAPPPCFAISRLQGL